METSNANERRICDLPRILSIHGCLLAANRIDALADANGMTAHFDIRKYFNKDWEEV